MSNEEDRVGTRWRTVSGWLVPLGAAALVLPAGAASAAESDTAVQQVPTATPTSTASPDPTASAAPGGAGEEQAAGASPSPDPDSKTKDDEGKSSTGKKKPAADKPQYTKERVWFRVSPGDPGKYGVGQLVTLDFGRDVVRKKAVERAIRVKSHKALPPGAWGWIDGNTAVYRPKRFWPANAKIKFSVNLRGVVLAQEGTTRFVGSGNKEFTLRTARSFVLRIRDSKHRLYVERDGRTIKSFPVSLGKSEGGYRTRSGIKILTGEKYSRLRMTGTDRGTGESWDVISPYSIRLTPTGEFIHGAPWAYSRMGRWNGSHGCTNMYIADAKWLFNRVMRGDPTVTTGTGRPMEVTNGTPGAYWNYTWKQWRAKSALK